MSKAFLLWLCSLVFSFVFVLIQARQVSGTQNVEEKVEFFYQKKPSKKHFSIDQKRSIVQKSCAGTREK
jgi:hypothetical protein